MHGNRGIVDPKLGHHLWPLARAPGKGGVDYSTYIQIHTSPLLLTGGFRIRVTLMKKRKQLAKKARGAFGTGAQEVGIGAGLMGKMNKRRRGGALYFSKTNPSLYGSSPWPEIMCTKYPNQCVFVVTQCYM